MMLERATDAKFINAVANHPAVRPHILAKANEALDFAPVAADTNNVILVGPYGGMIFHRLLPGLFEVHTLMLPEGRGDGTLDMAHSALLYMFSCTVSR